MTNAHVTSACVIHNVMGRRFGPQRSNGQNLPSNLADDSVEKNIVGSSLDEIGCLLCLKCVEVVDKARGPCETSKDEKRE